MKFRQCLSGAFGRIGRVTPQNNFVGIFANYFEGGSTCFFNHPKPKPILNHLEINFQNYFELREVFLSNSRTLQNNLFANFQKIIFEEVGSDKGYYFGVVRVFWKKYFVVGYVLEAPQNKSQKLFWGGHPSDFTQGSPHRKCINVMVGITQSKVTFLVENAGHKRFWLWIFGPRVHDSFCVFPGLFI